MSVLIKISVIPLFQFTINVRVCIIRGNWIFIDVVVVQRWCLTVNTTVIGLIPMRGMNYFHLLLAKKVKRSVELPLLKVVGKLGDVAFFSFFLYMLLFVEYISLSSWNNSRAYRVKWICHILYRNEKLTIKMLELFFYRQKKTTP